MIKDSFCCSNCFNNHFIQKYIEDNAEEEGNCPYCKSNKVQMISLETMGKYLRECIEKAYEGCDDGTGAMYDSEEEMYLGADGEEATTYSIREILTDEEMIFSDDTIETSLLEDLFENYYSYREIQKGAKDPFDDIDSQMWVIKDDLLSTCPTPLPPSGESPVPPPILSSSPLIVPQLHQEHRSSSSVAGPGPELSLGVRWVWVLCAFPTL